MIDGSKLPQLKPLDTRLNVYRNDLADCRLKGDVEADKFVEGKQARICRFFADISCDEGLEKPLDAQLVYGEPILVFDERADRLWIQSIRHGYVGWVDKGAVSFDMAEPTHWVSAPRTFLYPDPDMKTPRCGYRSMGSYITVTGEAETRGTPYAILESGEAIVADHIAPLDQRADDFVTVAEQLLNAPYLWGGDTAFGLDCSGLVGLSLKMVGKNVLRDSDMQAASLGKIVNDFTSWSDLRRGDLIFWRGHVGICQGMKHGTPMLIHANGKTMSVFSEPLEAAIERIAFLYEMPIGVRRI